MIRFRLNYTNIIDMNIIFSLLYVMNYYYQEMIFPVSIYIKYFSFYQKGD